MHQRLNSAAAGYIVAIVVVLVLTATSWSFTQRTSRAQAFVSHTHEVLSNVAAAEAALWRAESAQRAFLVSLGKLFLVERDTALNVLEQHVTALVRLTLDNPGQQLRIATLRTLLQERIAVYRRNESIAEPTNTMSAAQRLEVGAEVMERLQPMFRELAAEEYRLLRLREAQERNYLQSTRWIFGGLLMAILATVPLVFWQLTRQSRARARAEADAAMERNYTQLHGQALTLYNSATDPQAALEGALELLTAQPVFQAAALYVRTDMQQWRAAANRGVPPEVAAVLLPDKGPAGEAVRQRRLVRVRSTDDDVSPVLSRWLASQGTVNVVLCPVAYAEQTLGLLGLAATSRLSSRECDFIEQLCAQLGVALHNLDQYHSLNELAARLQEQGQELQRKNAALEDAARSKSEFLANMSHELRTPLNAVIGFADVLHDGLVGELNPEQLEYIGEISSSGKHLLSLINDVLDLAKVEAGQMSLELEPLNPAELAASGMSMLRERALQQRVQLRAQVAQNLGLLQADLRKTRQILFNLLSNAVKFTPAGGEVSVHLQRVFRQQVQGVKSDGHTRVIPPAQTQHGEFLEITVRDSGIGIEPANLERLFQPFMQIDSTLSRQFTGTGLGLSLVLRLTELHGGGLRVHSVPQQGSAFTAWLPWRPAETVSETPPPAAYPLQLGEVPLVLVIDDDPSALDLMQIQLQSSGWRVETAGDAAQGLRAVHELHPQAIVLDLLLPGIDGWSLLAQLKQEPSTRDIPVVICSVIAQRQRGFVLGAAQVLTKPVSQQQLLSALAAVGLPLRGPAARVLLVDDDEQELQSLSQQLQAAGLTAEPVLGGTAALDAVARRRPDVIVLKLDMQGLSGFDTVQALNGRLDTADIPIIVLAAPTDGSRAREMLHSQVLGIVEKSEFSASILVSELRRAMAHRAAGGASQPYLP
ncbi:response regulator [Azohydromonas lata]|uniref:histidine kinase n=1 Tax=Azohydromonas lata TaxID=45677 RepID=A0ABU5ICY0_9BURK|nr:response regulator [Azohydromonas lata]MDZ5455823.1 response regulator [Azohydromonas lata]